jgi:hypothetical protein
MIKYKPTITAPNIIIFCVENILLVFVPFLLAIAKVVLYGVIMNFLAALSKPL